MEKKEITKNYSNGEVTVVWKPSLCIHSGICVRGLPGVFNPKIKPWINPDNAESSGIVEQVKKCPSGALSYFMNETGPDTPVSSEIIAEISPNGPLLVYGNIKVKDAAGNLIQKSKVTAFCRCGASGNKPYCDGSHRKIGFTG